MRTILVANIKGGCGKTTIATHLAAEAAGRGLKVLLADVDRQRSSLGWIEARPAGVPALRGVDWVKEIGKAPKSVDRLIIDAPAAMKMKQVETLVRAADIIVLPVLPSAFDEAATARFLSRIEELKPIRKARTTVLVVGNRMRVRTRAAARLDRFLGAQGHTVAARLRDSAVYTDLAAEGTSLFDLRTKRIEGLKEDWRPLLDAIEIAG